jgi:uncharacterized repeat protein (TIGR03803 family)
MITRAALSALVALASGFVGGEATAASTATETVIHSFTGGTDGALPLGPPIFDSSGNLYGATEGGQSNSGSVAYATVFELSPPATESGGWTETVLTVFKGAAAPAAGVSFDAKGRLYGTTFDGGANGGGMVFRLKRPATPGGPWKRSSLYSFGPRGQPQAPVFVDSSNLVYGVTSSDGASKEGTLFRLRPPTTGTLWTRKNLLAFPGYPVGAKPVAAPYVDAEGNFWGTATTGGGFTPMGTVYELSKASSGWQSSVIWQFSGSPDGSNPRGPLLFDTAGNIYGTTDQGGTCSVSGGCGIVFELVPTVADGVTQWNETILYSFAGGTDGATPDCGLVMDSAGNLYGTTVYGGGSNNAGTVFKLSPPVSGTAWTETVLYTFTGGADGGIPVGSLAADAKGKFYGFALHGGTDGYGVVYEITP